MCSTVLLVHRESKNMLECGMLIRDKKALRSRSTVLLKELEVDALLLQCLQTEEILTENMAESIMAEQTSHNRSWRLLNLLPKRGPRAFSSFCSALRETEQQHLCDLLMQSQEQHDRETHVDSVVEPVEEPERESEQQVKERRGKKGENSASSAIPLSTQEETPAKRTRTEESMEFSLTADSPISSPVLPCSHEFYLSRYKQSYRMNSTPRGFALVISNVTFDPHMAPELDQRKGGEVDDEVLRKVFTELGYPVAVHRDLTAQAMRTCIENFCMRPDHRTVDSCVVCVLSHGVEGAVYGTDGQLLQLDWLFDAFDNAHCPLLQNKPKIFFIQACRGDEMDCGVEQLDGPGRTGREQPDAGREGQGDADLKRMDLGTPRVKLPQRSDMICGFASLKGTAAMRNTKRGSWFIQELNSALRLRAKDTHLADILVQVNGRIKEREGYAPGTAHHRCKEMSEFTSSLCKDLYFFPKHQSQY
ncbi:caspase-2 isoform X2 [Gouania willdenowi]|uniref:caspase-2 isoform X2 n=1 Tax=Gouania willdenowi TaxID=441366 RepID=UPI0010556CB6|nr:caspase-2 isoform X2 [Gouania willdenowi]